MEAMRIDLYEAGEYHYERAYGFMPNIRAYLHGDEKTYPAILIIPGGGYEFVSAREGELVAERFLSLGYNCFVLTYSVNLLDLTPLKRQPLKDAARAIRIIRKNAAAWHIDPERTAVLGFSAGGHLAGSLALHYKDAEEKNPELAAVNARPDAALLCYPVITSGEYAHMGTVKALLGFNERTEETGREIFGEAMPGCETAEDELRYASLETQVTEDAPPTFLWHTLTDASVPVENSLFMARALRKCGVPFALHLFSRGKHGLSLANEEWANCSGKGEYTYEPSRTFTNAALRGELKLPEEVVKELMESEHFGSGVSGRNDIPVPEVQKWPELADAFLKAYLH
ncbi:MAG: alpha/beta hydrolase [Lachnospiraceae bacterium]|nr:alpha/beta hydrolase [Lachnospiraceae bacterium]